jgi:hypothetical protein
VEIEHRQGNSLVTTSDYGWSLGKFGIKNEGSNNAYGFANTGTGEPLFSVLTPVPEPGNLGMVGLGAVMGMMALRSQTRMDGKARGND